MIFPSGTEGRMTAADAARMGLRPVSGETPAPVEEKTPAPKPSELRAWAAENGVECPAKGRVPESVLEAYNNR